MVRPAPISLRIRRAKITAQARQLLRSLNEKDLLRRRVKWQALKALIAVRELRSNAMKLKSADYPWLEDRWLEEVKSIEPILQKIVSKAR